MHKHPSLHHGAHAARSAAANIQHMFHKGSGSTPPSAPGLGMGDPSGGMPAPPSGPPPSGPPPGAPPGGPPPGQPSFVDTSAPVPPPPLTGG